MDKEWADPDLSPTFDLTQPLLQIPTRMTGALLQAIGSDYQMIGLRYDLQRSGMIVELERCTLSKAGTE